MARLPLLVLAPAGRCAGVLGVQKARSGTEISLRLAWLAVTTPVLPHRRLEQRDQRATGRAPPTFTGGSTWGRAAPRLVEGCGARARDGARVRPAREQHTAHRRVTWSGLGLEMGLGVGIG